MLDDLKTELELLRDSIKRARIGKVLPDSFYISRNMAESLNASFFERLAARIQSQNENQAEPAMRPPWNVLKVSKIKPAFSLLAYESPDEVAFPELLASTAINLDTGRVLFQDYRSRSNRFILHRKELLFTGAGDQASEWKELTRQCESEGLFDEPRKIGTSEAWKQRLRSKGLTVEGHRLRKVKEHQ